MGQVLASVDLRRLRRQVHRPPVRERLQLRIGEGLVKLGTRDVQHQLLVSGHQRQFKLLTIDAKAVAWTKPNHLPSRLEQFRSIPDAT